MNDDGHAITPQAQLLRETYVMCAAPASSTTDAMLLVAVVRTPGLSGSGEDVLDVNRTITYYGDCPNNCTSSSNGCALAGIPGAHGAHPAQQAACVC